MPSTPGTVNYPTALDDSVSLIDAGNLATTTLASTFLTADLTAHLTDASLFPASGTFSVESEIVYYTGKATNDLTGCVRAREGTTAVDHAGGLTVQGLVTARHHTVLRDAIVAAETELGVGARMSRIYNQRGGATRAVVLPAGSFSSDEVVALGNGTLEVPATGTLILNDAGQVPAKILQGGIRNVVRDYGATAWPDASQAINQAIADASSDGGGIVEVPSAGTAPMSAGLVWGYYNISQIRMQSNVWLRGLGLGSQLRSISSNPNQALVVLDNPNVAQTMISDISLFAGANQATAHGIFYDNTGGSGLGGGHRLYRLFLFGGFQDGIHFLHAGGNHLTDVSVQGVQGNGFMFDTGSTDNSLFDCSAGVSGLAGFLDTAANNRYVTCKAFLSGAVTPSLGDGFRISPFTNYMVRCEAQSNRNHGFSWVQPGGGQWSDGVALLADSNAGDAFHFDNASRNHVSGNVTFGNPDGIGPHANIVGFANTCSGNVIDVAYDAGALIAGGQIIAGSYSGTSNDVEVRQFGAPMSSALTLNLRSDTFGAMVVPQNSDYGVSERLVIGASSTIEVPATSSMTIYNVT